MKKHLPLVLTLVMVVLLCGLGVWQLQRLEWKNRLLDDMAQKAELPVLRLDDKIKNPQDWEYRRVQVEGVLINRHEMLLKPRTKDGRAGFDVLTPLRIKRTDEVVLINRGFADDKTLSAFYRPRGTLRIEGIVHIPRKGMFTPANNPAKNDWYWADTAEIAKSKNIHGLMPIVVSVTGGVPDLPNNHKQYAFFWFTMAGAALAVYLVYRRKGRAA